MALGDIPVYSTDGAASIGTQPDYSLYDELPRNHPNNHSQRQPSSSQRRPAVEQLPRGDWKYVSHIKDVTLAPSQYPRELRRSERRPGEEAQQYRMYPYEKSSRMANSAAVVGGPQNLVSSKPPRIKSSNNYVTSRQPETQQQRY